MARATAMALGMSQDGALGYAEHGWSYTAILGHYYTGTAIGQAPANAGVKVLVGSKVKSIPLETYVRGVVSAEVSASWPMAALEAQAVASRTFAITAHAGGSKFDVYCRRPLSGVSRQSRGNLAHERGGGGHRRSNRHLCRAAGDHLLLRWLWRTDRERAERLSRLSPEPWLVSVADPYEAGPLHRWTLTMSFARRRALERAGEGLV